MTTNTNTKLVVVVVLLLAYCALVGTAILAIV